MEKNQVITNLLAAGSKRVNSLSVKSISIAPQENYVRVAITFKEQVEGYVTEDNGVSYVEGKTSTIFVSLYSITAILKENDDASFAVPNILENPKSLNVLLAKAKMDIIQEPVTAGQEYANPWSDDAEKKIFDHDTIINHIVGIDLSDFAKAKLDRLADSMLGI